MHHSRAVAPAAKASDMQGFPLTVDLLSDLTDEAPAGRRPLGGRPRPAIAAGLQEEQAVVSKYKQWGPPDLSGTGQYMEPAFAELPDRLAT